MCGLTGGRSRRRRCVRSCVGRIAAPRFSPRCVRVRWAPIPGLCSFLAGAVNCVCFALGCPASGPHDPTNRLISKDRNNCPPVHISRKDEHRPLLGVSGKVARPGNLSIRRVLHGSLVPTDRLAGYGLGSGWWRVCFPVTYRQISRLWIGGWQVASMLPDAAISDPH